MHIGYFQGMNFIAANMLVSLRNNDEATFWGMIQMFSRFQLEELYDTASLKFKVLTYQIEVILFEQMPKLADFVLNKMEVSLDIYTVRWFFSMFNIDLTFTYSQTVLDLYMFDQSEVLIRTTLALFKVLQPKILSTPDSESLHDILKEVSSNLDFKMQAKSEFFATAYNFDLPTTVLKELEECFRRGKTHTEALAEI